MNSLTTGANLPAPTWMVRCAARIRDIDVTASELEAEALAQALWATPGHRSESPEAAAENVCAKCFTGAW
ncbi:MAG: hypothetical protein ABUL50_00545 [Rhizobacter sp.]